MTRGLEGVIQQTTVNTGKINAEVVKKKTEKKYFFNFLTTNAPII